MLASLSHTRLYLAHDYATSATCTAPSHTHPHACRNSSAPVREPTAPWLHSLRPSESHAGEHGRRGACGTRVPPQRFSCNRRGSHAEQPLGGAAVVGELHVREPLAQPPQQRVLLRARIATCTRRAIRGSVCVRVSASASACEWSSAYGIMRVQHAGSRREGRCCH